MQLLKNAWPCPLRHPSSKICRYASPKYSNSMSACVCVCVRTRVSIVATTQSLELERRFLQFVPSVVRCCVPIEENLPPSFRMYSQLHSSQKAGIHSVVQIVCQKGMLRGPCRQHEWCHVYLYMPLHIDICINICVNAFLPASVHMYPFALTEHAMS